MGSSMGTFLCCYWQFVSGTITVVTVSMKVLHFFLFWGVEGVLDIYEFHKT